jgi:hypothetical protein
MKCLCSLKHWDRGFESHSKHGCLFVRLFCVCVALCVQVATLQRADPPSKVSCRQCKKVYETEEKARAYQTSVEPLMNE